jgi:ATP-dependent Clp protease protease subunit
MKKLTKIGSDLDLHYLQETRTILFHHEVGQSRVTDALTSMDYLARLNKKPITLRLCSPGGSVDYGLVLYDYIKSSKVPIYTICSGMAASMAAILLGSGKKGKRFATKNSRIMIHQPSSGFIGKAIDIEIHAKETARIRSLLNNIIANDTGQKLSKVSKDTELDFWMTAEQALKYGLIDKII